MKKIVSLFAAIVMTVGIMSAMPLTVNAASKGTNSAFDKPAQLSLSMVRMLASIEIISDL